MIQKIEASVPVRNLRRRIKPTLEHQLCEVLMRHVGERGHDEGAVDTLCRILHERDQAMTLLALDRMRSDH
jgi:hypothetical protein